MKTLSHPLPAPPRWFSPGGVCFLLWAPLIAAFEFMGRAASSDVGDAVALAVLFLCVFLSAVVHSQSPLPVIGRVGRLVRRMWSRVQGLRLRIGVDFRETPPIPRAVPGVYAKTLLSLAVLIALLYAARGWLPEAGRSVLGEYSYTAYLLTLGVLWSAMLMGTMMLGLLPLAVIHDYFVNRHTGQGPRPVRSEMLTLFGLVFLVVIAASLLPTWTPLVILLLVLGGVLGILSMPSTPDLVMVWKPRGGDGPLRSIRLREQAAVHFLLVFFSVAIVILLARGSRIGPGGAGPSASMNLTLNFGFVFSWAAAAGLTTFNILLVRLVWLGRRQDPSQEERPMVFVHGHTTAEERQQIVAVLNTHGWNVRFPPLSPERTDVQLEYAPGMGEDVPLDAEWPLMVSLDTIAHPENLRRYRRRDEIQKRRILTRGLQKLFKRAASRKYRSGKGFWIGLHHWYVTGLTRDAVDDDDYREAVLEQIIGPPYHRIFPRCVRHHFHQMMRALELDLIFVEDGVGYRRLRKVFTCMYEVYDVYGGRQRAEEKHFVGIPKVRVVIHEFTPGESGPGEQSDKGYPEPDYEDIGRARILHVFRDRGGHEERIDAPTDDEHVPVAGGVL